MKLVLQITYFPIRVDFSYASGALPPPTPIRIKRRISKNSQKPPPPPPAKKIMHTLVISDSDPRISNNRNM